MVSLQLSLPRGLAIVRGEPVELLEVNCSSLVLGSRSDFPEPSESFVEAGARKVIVLVYYDRGAPGTMMQLILLIKVTKHLAQRVRRPWTRDRRHVQLGIQRTRDVHTLDDWLRRFVEADELEDIGILVRK
jgi:hypothetical protein